MHVQYRLSPGMVTKYLFIQFQAALYNIILHPCGEPNKKSFPTYFLLENANIEQEIKYWPAEWLT